MAIYIQRKDGREVETVDEFTTRKGARENLREYQLSEPGVHYYTSSRACKHWKEKR